VNHAKPIAKAGARGAALLAALPWACLAGFGRFRGGFRFGAQALALAPGAPGSYLRVAYYSLTLDGCGRDSRIEIGSYFAHPRASLGGRVGIGAYCVLGQVDIGAGTQLASGVQIVSGTRQHARDAQGRLTDEGRVFERLKVGAECWIRAGAILLAGLGDRVTVGAGSVVTKDVPSGAKVAGNPARLVRIEEAAEPAE
jgi:acetyltransferase-like isoleucine patch superfamily enzyme